MVSRRRVTPVQTEEDLKTVDSKKDNHVDRTRQDVDRKAKVSSSPSSRATVRASSSSRPLPEPSETTHVQQVLVSRNTLCKTERAKLDEAVKPRQSTSSVGLENGTPRPHEGTYDDDTMADAVPPREDNPKPNNTISSDDETSAEDVRPNPQFECLSHDCADLVGLQGSANYLLRKIASAHPRDFQNTDCWVHA